MQSRFFTKKVIPLQVGLWLIICTSLCPLLLASDLPSGLPDDLSDMSPFDPCMGRLNCQPPPRCPWYARADALLLKRDRVDREPIAALTVPENVIFSTNDLDSPFRAGPKFLLGRTLGDSRWQVDFTFFWVDDWDANTSIHDHTINPFGLEGDLYSPFSNFGDPAADANYDYNNFVSIREFSEFRNGELNLRYTLPMPHCCLTPKLIIGLRYIDVHEQFYYNSRSNIHPDVSITTRTTNDLFGPQLGGDFYFYAFPNCWINFEFKGAICSNTALQDTTEGLPGRQSRTATSYVGDLDLSITWQMTRRLLTRIGYQAVWIQNLAMASRNFVQPIDDIEPTIDTNGRSVFHGPHIGLELTW
jgi:hypothetical protein